MTNIYYELSDNHPADLRYWVESNVSYRPFYSGLLVAASRVWIEENSEVRSVKDRYKELSSSVGDINAFNTVKLLARDLHMMSMKKFSEGVIYISFPPLNFSFEKYIIPDGLEEWIEMNTTPEWGIIEGKRAGVFLSEEDAIAFRLKWM